MPAATVSERMAALSDRELQELAGTIKNDPAGGVLAVIVVVSPSDPPVSADVLGWLRAGAPFVSTGNRQACIGQLLDRKLNRIETQTFDRTDCGNEPHPVLYLQ